MSKRDNAENLRLMGAFDVLIKEMKANERGMNQAIEERDAAEECLSQMYYLVTGRSPEWSNNFGHAQALEDVSDVMAALKAAAKSELVR